MSDLINKHINQEKMKVGQLYKCLNFSLLIYPTIEKLTSASGDHSISAGVHVKELHPHNTDKAAFWADFWSKELKCQVRFSQPNEIFMFLGRIEKSGRRNREYGHVLFGEKQGWIIIRNYLKFVPVGAQTSYEI